MRCEQLADATNLPERHLYAFTLTPGRTPQTGNAGAYTATGMFCASGSVGVSETRRETLGAWGHLCLHCRRGSTVSLKLSKPGPTASDGSPLHPPSGPLCTPFPQLTRPPLSCKQFGRSCQKERSLRKVHACLLTITSSGWQIPTGQRCVEAHRDGWTDRQMGEFNFMADG